MLLVLEVLRPLQKLDWLLQKILNIIFDLGHLDLAQFLLRRFELKFGQRHKLALVITFLGQHFSLCHDWLFFSPFLQTHGFQGFILAFVRINQETSFRLLLSVLRCRMQVNLRQAG